MDIAEGVLKVFHTSFNAISGREPPKCNRGSSSSGRTCPMLILVPGVHNETLNMSSTNAQCIGPRKGLRDVTWFRTGRLVRTKEGPDKSNNCETLKPGRPLGVSKIRLLCQNEDSSMWGSTLGSPIHGHSHDAWCCCSEPRNAASGPARKPAWVDRALGPAQGLLSNGV